MAFLFVLSMRGEAPKKFLTEIGEVWQRFKAIFIAYFRDTVVCIKQLSPKYLPYVAPCIHSYTGSWNTLLKIRRRVLTV